MFTIKMFKIENGDHHTHAAMEAVSYTISNREASISFTAPPDPNNSLVKSAPMTKIDVRPKGGWQKVIVENAAGKTITTLNWSMRAEPWPEEDLKDAG